MGTSSSRKGQPSIAGSKREREREREEILLPWDTYKVFNSNSSYEWSLSNNNNNNYYYDDDTATDILGQEIIQNFCELAHKGTPLFGTIIIILLLIIAHGPGGYGKLPG